MSIKVDPEFKALIPPLTPDEYTQLEKNILKDGIRDALIVWPQPNGDDILIDGHNRFEISAAHAGIRFNIRRMEFKDRGEAIVWIANNQLGRRNLHQLDQEKLMSARQKIISASAERRMKAGVKADPSEKFPKGTGTREVIGKELNISGRQVDKLHTINEKATEQTKQLVREGKLSVNQAYNSVHPKRPDPVKQAREEHKQFAEAKKNGVVDMAAIRADRDNQEIIKTALFAEIWKLLNDIDSFGMRHKPEEIAGLYKEVEEDERQLIIDRCDVCRGILSRIQVSLVH